jgi:hypothetical protein
MAKHYGIVEWMAFARGVVPPAKQERMSEHLHEGCADCQGAADFFERLVSVCRDMIADDASDALIQRAQSIWPRSTPRQAESAVRIPVELLYDSSLAPAAVGLRASEVAGCHILYRAGDYSLDLHVEPEARSSRISVIGQIMKLNSERVEMSNITVALKWGTTRIAETLSNQFGEFQIGCEQRKQMQLCIYLEPFARFIEVPLPRFANENGQRG